VFFFDYTTQALLEGEGFEYSSAALPTAAVQGFLQLRQYDEKQPLLRSRATRLAQQCVCEPAIMMCIQP
jgi:hypothetical protein